MKYIEIIPGDASFPRLKEGDYISPVQRPSIEDTLNNVVLRQMLSNFNKFSIDNCKHFYAE
ncbi:MAG: hypothetical protein LBN19_04670 [Endomicrobium sp.]|jgi:hypothetical protein|nr:hypothetical protein [Endomicrobium sp.]